MSLRIFFSLILFLCLKSTYAQNPNLKPLDPLIGHWEGKGEGFGNQTSIIKASYTPVMAGKYIEVIHESRFAPTKLNPEGEHHIDKGFISYDTNRKKIIYRQFNIEGYINQYYLNEDLSDTHILVFESEQMENFSEGGKARLTIKVSDRNHIETIFDVSFPGKEFACFGTNRMVRISQ